MCSRTLLMQDGSIAFNGNTDEAIDRYLGASAKGGDILQHVGDFEGNNTSIEFLETKVHVPSNGVIKTTDNIPISVTLRFTETIEEFHLTLHLWTASEIRLLESSTKAIKVQKGDVKTFTYNIPERLLNENQFMAKFNMVIRRSTVIFSSPIVIRFSVVEAVEENDLLWYGKSNGILSVKIDTVVI